MLTGVFFYTPVRASQVRQVEGWRSDKAAHLLFFLLSYFSPLHFPIILLYYFSFFPSVYNLFALLGRKATFSFILSAHSTGGATMKTQIKSILSRTYFIQKIRYLRKLPFWRQKFPSSSLGKLNFNFNWYFFANSPPQHLFQLRTKKWTFSLTIYNLIKIQLFIILSFCYRMDIWQRPIVGHVQMTRIVSQSNLSLPDSESRKLSKLLVWSILMGWWNSPRWK